MPRALALLLALLLLVSALPTDVAGQSLGSVARKERDRRDKNKERGVEAKTFSETEIFGEDEEEEASEEESEAESLEGEGDAVDEGEGHKRPSMPPRIDVELAPIDEAPEDEARDRRQQEAEWRSRFKAARDRIAEAHERKRVLSSLHLTHGESYIDENGNTVVENLDHLRRLVREADAEVTAAEKALRDLEDEARRAGVPPGWRR